MSLRQSPFIALIVLTTLCAFACGPGPSGRGPSDELAAAFARPPDSARPWVYWIWMDGNLTREGITADWKHFAADSPLLASGLLGPVKILKYRRERP